GQNVNAWRGENYDGTTGTFADLLRLVAAIDGIDRIRFTTSHPASPTASPQACFVLIATAPVGEGAAVFCFSTLMREYPSEYGY
ncbi:hypothetical protein MJL48_33865, partial [Salmonella enterica subsp. enterica serovar Kentucky]|nr:hypothetical protein [Salmonella enterica subsp. enterica serovar Kentucky]